MWPNLVVSTAMIVVTTVIHMLGLLGLSILLDLNTRRYGHDLSYTRSAAAIVLVVLGIFATHGTQIWLYALLYLGLGALPSLEEALYFSASTFTTVGFGDITLDHDWRLLSAIESANGFILIGWSTAFLISVTSRLRKLEPHSFHPPHDHDSHVSHDRHGV